MIRFTVIIPAIVQNILNGQDLDVTGGSIQATSPDHVKMSIDTSLDTPIPARLDEVDLNLYNKDTEPMSSFLKLRLPGMHINKKTAVAVTNQTLAVTNQTELTAWFNEFFDKPEVDLSLDGEPTVHLGTLKYTRSLDKTIKVPSLNYLYGCSVLDLNFMLKSSDTKYNMKGHFNIPNAGVLTLGLGNLTFNLESGNTRLGLLHLDNVNLKPGNNSIPFYGVFYFDELVPNLSAVLDSQKESLHNGYILFHATGNSTIVDGKHIPYLEGVLNRKRIPFTLSVISLLGDVLGGILGADRGSLLDIFGEAVGNTTLFDNLLDHWSSSSGDGKDQSMRRSLTKKQKGGRSWMINLLKLGLRARKA